MPPRPTPHTCRALQHQIALPREGIWVPDALLASCFDRYCLVSKQHTRKSGNVPGPLESRRRLGKRQIGGLNVVQSTPSLPAWALSNTPDLSKWHWEPATPAAVRDEKLQQARLLEAALPAWLREWTPPDLETPVLQPRGERNATAVVSPPVAPITEELESFRRSALADLTTDIGAQLEDLCQRLEMQLSLGQVTGKDLEGTLRSVLELLVARPESSTGTANPSVALYLAVVNGIEASRVTKPTDFDQSFWRALLSPMAKLPANDDLCTVFDPVMNALPPKYHDQVSNEVLSVLDTFYSSWSITDGRGHSSVSGCLEVAAEASERCQNLVAAATACATNNLELARSLLQQAQDAHRTCRDALDAAAETLSPHRRQVQAVSRALSRVGLSKKLYTLANERILGRTLLSPQACHQLRYNWLSVLAQLPRVSQDALLAAHKALFIEPAAQSSLTNEEICQLFISRWQSLGRLTDPQRFGHIFESLCAKHESASIAALSYAVFRVERNRGWLIDAFCKFLGQLGRSEDLALSFQKLGQFEKLPVRLHERIATVSNDHRVAIGLHSAYIGGLSGRDASHWDSRIWWKYLDAIFVDPTVSPANIWKLLGIEFYEDRANGLQWRQPRRHCSHGKHSAAIVADLAVRFAHDDHLKNRVAFRHVSQCVVFLERYMKEVPLVVLQALYHVVSRDLTDGLPGRTARLQWFLRVVKRQLGYRNAEECTVLLQQWRHQILRLKQAAAMR